jgi:polyhydroxyalkanoate synthesis regulator phasin
MVKEIIKKMGLFGIGVLALTQEKLEELTQEMIAMGEMNKEEGKKFVQDVLTEKEKQFNKLGENVGLKVKEVIDKSHLATKTDVKGIDETIADLHKRMEKLEQKIEKLKEI